MLMLDFNELMHHLTMVSSVMVQACVDEGG